MSLVPQSEMVGRERRRPYDPTKKLAVREFDVTYRRAEGHEWLARIYQPQGEGPFPMMVDVHGGAWTAGSRLSNKLMGGELASGGLVVASVDFRLAPQHPYPAQVQDVNYATRWLKAHAGEFNGDAETVGGLGSSSGGHTVALSTMRARDPRYSAIPLEEAPDWDASLSWIISLWGVLDPYVRYTFAKRTKFERLVERSEGYFLNEEAMKEGNPQTLLERREFQGLPPFLIIQGTADGNIPMEIPEKFAASYREAGGSLEMEVFPGMGHSFTAEPGQATDRALSLMKDFVRRHLESL